MEIRYITETEWLEMRQKMTTGEALTFWRRLLQSSHKDEMPLGAYGMDKLGVVYAPIRES